MLLDICLFFVSLLLISVGFLLNQSKKGFILLIKALIDIGVIVLSNILNILANIQLRLADRPMPGPGKRQDTQLRSVEIQRYNTLFEL